MKISHFLLAFCLFSISLCDATCNDTHLQFFSEYSLGKLDQLNRTFTRIQQKIQVKDVSWTLNDTAQYTIKNIKTALYYIDTNQKAQVLGKDTIVISGGKLRATLDFNWTRGTAGGYGTAVGISQVLYFSMILQIKDGFAVARLTGQENVTFTNYGINITRISPADTTDQDQNNLKRLLNDILKVVTVRHQLQDAINNIYQAELSQSIYDQRRMISQNYTYTYKNYKNVSTNIQYVITPTLIDVDQSGMTLRFSARIKNYTDWTCESLKIQHNLNPRVYGGIQEFLSFDMYQNTLRYAATNSMLDADLNKAGWQSKYFQFYAGDLYEVIPKIAQTYEAKQIVTGSCSATPKGLKVSKATTVLDDTFSVNIRYDCQLGVSRSKIASFMVNLTLLVEGVANSNTLDFYIKSHTNTIILSSYLGFEIRNPTLALHMIDHSMDRLVGARVFGSGWKLYQRDYPHFMVDQDKNYTVVYDSSVVPGGEEEREM